MNVAEMQSQTVATDYNGWSNYETWLVNLWMTATKAITSSFARFYRRIATCTARLKRLRTKFDSNTTVSIRVYVQISSIIHLRKWIGIRSLREIRSNSEIS